VRCGLALDPPSQKTTGLAELSDSVIGIEERCSATARCRPDVVADKRVIAENEDR